MPLRQLDSLWEDNLGHPSVMLEFNCCLNCLSFQPEEKSPRGDEAERRRRPFVFHRAFYCRLVLQSDMNIMMEESQAGVLVCCLVSFVYPVMMPL